MARPLRIEYEDAFYHVMNRGRGRQRIFAGDDYYEDFLLCLEESHKRFGVEIHAYCLMGNHYHLLLKTPRGNLSRVMRHIDGIYTQRHNRRKKTDGPLFRGRYKAIVIDAHQYLLQVSRYIHRNPIEVRQPLVNRLHDYQWSSYPAYLNQASGCAGLKRDEIYDELGSIRRYQAYRRYVEVGNDEETSRFYQLKNTPSVWGDTAFREYAQSQAKSLDKEIDKKGLKQPVSMVSIIESVSAYYELSPEDIQRARRGKGAKNVPRWLAMKLCQDLAGARLADIGKVFHVQHYSTVSQTIGRLNRLMVEDERVKKVFNSLSQDLTP